MSPDKFGMIYVAGIATGACCVTSGCELLTSEQCANLGGTWTEAGSCDDCVAPPETCDADLDECECVGDADLDGYVNVNDLLIIIGYWGNNTPQADLNFDGIVDVTDLLIVVGNWGECE